MKYKIEIIFRIEFQDFTTFRVSLEIHEKSSLKIHINMFFKILDKRLLFI